MRVLFGIVLIVGLVWATIGCGRYGPKPFYEGPKTDSFSGQVVHEGKPVTFSGDNEAIIVFYSADGVQFGVPIKADGTFSIGWMPVGKQHLVLERASGGSGTTSKYGIPGEFTIEAGKSSGYVVELGKGFKRDAKAPDAGPKVNKATKG